MAWKLGYLAAVVILGLLCIEQSLGFAFRVYPGFKTNQGERGTGFFPPMQFTNNIPAANRFTRTLMPSMTGQVQEPVLEDAEPTTVTTAEKEDSSPVTSDPGLKTITFRRAGPLDECDNYIDCKSRLLSYLDVMRKMSNKG